MVKAMATRNFRTKKAKNNKNTGKAKFDLKKMARDGATDAGIMMHNSFIILIFGLAMLMAGLASISSAYIVIGILIGYENQGQLNTVSDLIVVMTTIIMASAFILFFALKLQNWLIKKMKERLWKKDKESGMIVKNNNNIIAEDDET